MRINPLQAVFHASIVVPLGAAMLAGFAALLFAFAAFIGRSIYFLKSGDWILSACSVSNTLAWNGFNIPNACYQFSFDWRGVNILLRWALIETDVSVSAMIVGAGLIIVGLIWLFSIAFVVRMSS